MNKQTQSMRCVQCGRIDVPRLVPGKPGWVALALWALSTVVWAVGLLLGLASVLYLGLALYLPALIYTLWYFDQRESACRHCGGHRFDSESSA